METIEKENTFFYKKSAMCCAIWYHLYNLKNVKNTHRGVLILVQLQASVVYEIDLGLIGLYFWFLTEAIVLLACSITKSDMVCQYFTQSFKILSVMYCHRIIVIVTIRDLRDMRNHKRFERP